MSSAPNTTGRPLSDRWSNPWMGLLPVGISFLGMAWLSWRRWPDVLIDFGLQLYLPWQLAEGRHLYDDIAYLPGGPLSQHYHAFLFRLFGSSLNVLLVSNFLIFGLLVVLVYRSFLQAADRLTAMVASLFLIVGFGFSHYVDVGNYSYICPYSHEVFHGLVLSVLLVVTLARAIETGKTRPFALAGFLLGLIFLTKAEVFLAATAASATALMLEAWQRRRDTAALVRALVTFAGLALVPPTLFLIYFLSFDNFAGSIQKVCWAWVPLLSSKVSHGQYYRTCLGLDAPAKHLSLMFLHFGVFGTALAFLAWRAPLAKHRTWERIALLILASAGSLYFEWLGAGQSMPLLVIVTLGIWVWIHRDTLRAARAFPVFALLWAVLGLVLLAKMGVHSHLWHYGAFLAMPAALTTIYLLLWLLPKSIGRLAQARPLFRTIIVCFLAFGLFRLTVQSWLFYHDKTLAVGKQPDYFLTAKADEDPRGEGTIKAIEWIAANTRKDQTLAVIPEGAMINYLTGRTNPTPYLVFMAEIDAYGERTMLAAYQRNPPDFIALAHRDTDEYGPGWFGERPGFGRDLMAWIRSAYTPVHLIGTLPFTSERFGIQILRRNTPSK